MSEISEAIKVLTESLKKDEGYFYSWKANIAMAFKDEWSRQASASGLPCTPEHIHEIANKSANNFLKQLCKEVENDI